MANATMAELLAQAESAGVSSYEPTNGNYTLEVTRANAGRTKAGDPKFGIQFKVQGGPDDGRSFWTNFNLIAMKKDGTPNPGLAYTFRDLAVLGADGPTIATWDIDAEDANAQVEAAIVGARVTAQVEVKQSGQYTNINLRNLRRAQGTPAPSGPAPSAPAAAPSPGPTGDRPF